MSEQKNDILIRLAAKHDAPAIATVLHDSFIEYEPRYTPEAFAATVSCPEHIETRISEGLTWVAVRDAAIVGTVSAAMRGESLYLRGMAVVPPARGLRVGEALLRQVEEFALTCCYDRLFLSTTPFLSRAIRLYERWGFRRNDEGPLDLHGTPLFTMEKPLIEGV